MRYGNIEFLWLFWIIPLVVGFYLYSFKRKKELFDRFIAPDLRERLLQGFSPSRQKFKIVLIILALFFSIVSLVRPQWGFHWEEVKRKGVDIMIAVDLSKSMLAEDVKPNRLERAKREIQDLLNMLQGDRVGLIAFSGVSFLQCPLTLDYGAIHLFLDQLSTDLIPVPGTAMGEAIKTSIKSFDKETKGGRVLILITDGEDNSGNPIEEAKKANDEKIRIYTIGIGKDGGAPIPDKENGGFKKDRKGEMVLSKLDEETLQKIALATSGSYVRSVSGGLELERIYQDIRKNVDDKELKSGKRKRFEERYQWTLLLVLLMLFFEAIYSERKMALFLLLLSFSVNVNAQFLEGRGKKGEDAYQSGKFAEAMKEFTNDQIDAPDDYKLKYNLGNSYYQTKQFDEAEKLYGATAINGEKEMAFKSFYNLGNVAYRQGKLQESLEFYKKALEINPNDEDVKFNLEFVKEEIRRRVEENKKTNEQCKNPQNKNDKNQNKDDQNKAAKKEENQKQNESSSKDKKENMTEGKKENAKKAQGDEQKKDDKKLSPEEIERWLSTLDENKKEQLKNERQDGTQEYNVEKDW